MLAGTRANAPSNPYFDSYPLTQRRGIGSTISALGGGYRHGNGLGFGFGVGAGGLTGFGGFNRLGGVGGVGGISGLSAPRGFSGLQGMQTRPRLSPLLDGAANLNPIYNALNVAQRAGFPQADLSGLLHRRSDGHQIFSNHANTDRYVQPRMREDHLTLPVFVQSSRRSYSHYGRGANNEFTLTMPACATVADIEIELQQGNWALSQVIVFTHDNNSVYLYQLRDVDELIELGAVALVIDESQWAP